MKEPMTPTDIFLAIACAIFVATFWLTNRLHAAADRQRQDWFAKMERDTADMRRGK